MGPCARLAITSTGMYAYDCLHQAHAHVSGASHMRLAFTNQGVMVATFAPHVRGSMGWTPPHPRYSLWVQHDQYAGSDTQRWVGICVCSRSQQFSATVHSSAGCGSACCMCHSRCHTRLHMWQSTLWVTSWCSLWVVIATLCFPCGRGALLQQWSGSDHSTPSSRAPLSTIERLTQQRTQRMRVHACPRRSGGSCGKSDGCAMNE